MHNQAAARALKPHIPAINPTVQVAAPLVLAFEGHQGGEKSRHGTGRLSRRYRYLPATPGYSEVRA